jgi:hypothetical protein
VRPLYFAVGIAQDGALDILGVWLERRNDSDFWNRCMMELRNHGLSDILIGIVDRESAFTALQSIYPSALAYVVPSEMFKSRSGKRKRSGSAPMLCTLPDAVHLFIESIDPFKSLIAKLRRGGFKALSCFRSGNEAVDLAVVILRPIDIVWAVQPSSWASVKPDLDALYLQRNT